MHRRHDPIDTLRVQLRQGEAELTRLTASEYEHRTAANEYRRQRLAQQDRVDDLRAAIGDLLR